MKKRKRGAPRKFSKTYPLYMSDSEYAKVQALSCASGRTIAAEIRRLIDAEKIEKK
jgi:predicted DNA-binding protein